MANGNGNGVAAMWKVIGSLVLAFILGGVWLYARSEAADARTTALEQRLDRRDMIDAEFRADVKTGLTEIRNKLDLSLQQKGKGE